MRDYEQVFQGDVWLMKLPDNRKINFENELPKKFNKLVLQEGEMTGHHHYVDSVMDRPAPQIGTGDADINLDVFNDKQLKKSLGGKRKEAKATLFGAAKIAEELVKEGTLLRADLVVGLLNVDGGAMNVYHQEHNSITLPPGRYIVGRQIESVAGEERRVAD